MGWSCRAEQSKSLERIDNAIHGQPDYKLDPPKAGILISLFEPNGRDFGDPPHNNMRVKIERITSSFKDERNTWHSYTTPVGVITIAPDGSLKFSSRKLKAEMANIGLEAAAARKGTTAYVPQRYLGHGPHYNVRRDIEKSSKGGHQ